MEPVYTEKILVRPKGMFWLLSWATVISLGLPLVLIGSNWDAEETWVYAGIFVFLAMVWWFMLASRIILKLDFQGVHYQFYPFKSHFVSWHDLREWYLRKVDVMGEFGGWGYRYAFTGKSWGYVTDCKFGLQLVYKDNRRIVISTRFPDAVEAWLEQWAPVVQSS